MATKRTARPVLTADFEGSPYRVAFTRGAGYSVVEVETGAEHALFGTGPDEYQQAYEDAAARNTEAARTAAPIVTPAEVPAIAPDAETWQAISEIVYPAPAPAATPLVAYPDPTPALSLTPAMIAIFEQYDPAQTLRRADIFDALCIAADCARDYWQHVKSRRELYDVAWGWLLEQEVFYFDAAGCLLVPSSDEQGAYTVDVSCNCQAGRWGNYCRHSAAADIIGRARNLIRAGHKIAA